MQALKPHASPSTSKSLPGRRLLPCTGNCQPLMSGFIKVTQILQSATRNQFSVLGVESKPDTKRIEAVIVRVNCSTDNGGNFQSMLKQLASNDPKRPLLFRLNLASEQSMGCACGNFACFREKTDHNDEDNRF